MIGAQCLKESKFRGRKAKQKQKERVPACSGLAKMFP
jgi:hypothetical protein